MRRGIFRVNCPAGMNSQKPLRLIVLCTLLAFFSSCMDDLNDADGNLPFQSTLSAYGIFQGSPQDLHPQPGFYEYQLATELFSDYAEKQRLIHLPAGGRLVMTGDDLPEFPDSTVIVKTFYYHKDRRDTMHGKRILETRLLIKHNSRWNVATYVWNDQQTDATLVTSGYNTTVNFTDADGHRHVISYHVPNTRECATCHQADETILPIGPKLRNLNMDVMVNESTINQLQHFQDLGLLSTFDTSQLPSLPRAFREGVPLAAQARAYLDMNCAHCHNPKGKGKDAGLNLSFTLSESESGITGKKDQIRQRIGSGQMPRIGTTVVHAEGLKLIEDYIRAL